MSEFRYSDKLAVEVELIDRKLEGIKKLKKLRRKLLKQRNRLIDEMMKSETWEDNGFDGELYAEEMLQRELRK